MTMLAAVHVHPVVSMLLACVVCAILVWYWHRLGGDEVPESRRRIRRASLVVMFASLPVMVRALSFVDEQTPVDYIVSWAMILVLLLLVVLTAFIDLWNNVRLRQIALEEEAVDAAARLHKAINEQRGEDDS